MAIDKLAVVIGGKVLVSEPRQGPDFCSRCVFQTNSVGRINCEARRTHGGQFRDLCSSFSIVWVSADE